MGEIVCSLKDGNGDCESTSFVELAFYFYGSFVFVDDFFTNE